MPNFDITIGWEGDLNFHFGSTSAEIFSAAGDCINNYSMSQCLQGSTKKEVEAVFKSTTSIVNRFFDIQTQWVLFTVNI